MAGWDSYTQKSTPADADTLMIKDTSGGANKRTPFSGVWNWILTKLTNAVISQLETTNKSIIPAINELNSKSIFGKISKRYYTKQLSSESDYVTLATINLKKDDVLVVKTEWMTGKPTGIKIVDADHDIVYAISENDLGYLNLFFSPSGTRGAYSLNIQEKNSNPNGFSSVGVIIISPTY